MREDPWLDILLPAAEAILEAGTDDEAAATRERLRLTLALVAQRIIDEDIRVQWFRAHTGLELTRLAGPLDEAVSKGGTAAGSPDLSGREILILELLTQGRSNREIAEEIKESEESVLRLLADLYVKIGASSRADATAVALMGKLV
jgi:DNA-binding NarL/FixJ family response regulator